MKKGTALGAAGLLALALGFLAPVAQAQGPQVGAEAEAQARLNLAENPNLQGSDFGWGQLYLEGRGEIAAGPYVVGALGLGVMGQAGGDPRSAVSAGQARLTRASLGALGLAGGRLDVEAGRVGVRFGEGFLLADGVPAQAGAGPGPWATPWDDFTGMRIRGESPELALEGLVAWAEGGALIAGDGRWSLPTPGPLRGDAGLSLVALARAGAPRHMAALRGSLGLGGAGLRGELALQGGADGDVARLGAAGYLRGHWDVAQLPLPTLVTGGVTFYSGDNASSPRVEAWEPLFQGDPGTSPFSQGVLSPFLPGYNTDQLTFALGSEVEVRPDHALGLGGLLRLSHRGTAACAEVYGAPACVDLGGGALGTAGAATPMLAEVDLRYAHTRGSPLGPVRYGAEVGVGAPLAGARLPVGGGEGGGMLLGDRRAFALAFFSEMHF